jgi:Mrp family chromosome partitioning ATPase
LPHRAALDLAQKDEAFQEALRKLYGSLVFATGNRKTQTVLVASPGACEGKTFLTLALARFVAASGRRVLVVECDMRRPILKSALGLEGNHGLLDVLRGIAAPQSLATSVIPGLDILAAGGPVTEPIELLVANRMPDFVRSVQSYDLVLLDAPSSESLIDACMFAKHADGILCCAHWGRTSIDGIVEALNGIRGAGGLVLGTVITMVNPNGYRLYEPAPTSTASIAYLKAS